MAVAGRLGPSRIKDRPCAGNAPEESTRAEPAEEGPLGDGSAAVPGASPQTHQMWVSLPVAASQVVGTGSFRESVAVQTVIHASTSRPSFANRIPKRPRLSKSLFLRDWPAAPGRVKLGRLLNLSAERALGN